MTAINFYLVLGVSYVALRWVLKQASWFTELIGYLLHLVLLPALLLFPASLWRGWWMQALVSGILIAAFLRVFLQSFAPKPRAVPADSAPLTVLTFNTGNDFIAPDDLIEVLRSSGADIAGLQELSPRNADALAACLEQEFPYRVLRGKYFEGKGLLSRHPIIEHSWFTLDGGRPYLKAGVQVDGQRMTVIVAHAPSPNYRRLEIISPHAAAEIQSLVDDGAPDQPALLIGDFNFTDQNQNYQLLAQAGWRDTYRKASRSFGFTFPTRHQYVKLPLLPLVRIDYIWATSHFQPISSHVGRGRGSDHLPVISTLALVEPRESGGSG